MLDQTDLEILNSLKDNCKIQLKDIGDKVHLTGQAVANRISKMESMGIIRGYSVILDERLLGNTIMAYVTIFMKTTNHKAFLEFIKSNLLILEADRISGEGCYLLKVQSKTQEELNNLLDSILEFGNYRVSISIGKVK